MERPRQPYSRHDFEIALICALGSESDAVEAFFDEIYDLNYGKAQGDPNAYTFGRMSGHHVVLAHMPGIGKVNSATVAAGVRSSFTNIKLGLVTGICGGVPFAQNGDDIRLGDVVVSTGVVQFDFGRQYPDKTIKKNLLEDPRGHPNLEVRSFLSNLSRRRVSMKLRDSTSAYLEKLYQIHDFAASAYPGEFEDKLYSPTYRHKHQDENSCKICAYSENPEDEVCDESRTASCAELLCDDSKVVKRAHIGELEHNAPKGSTHKPSVHFGRVGSGDVVMRSGAHRDRLATQEGVIAFEMEGAGVWDILPTVIVKGVSDYADSHKNKRWQRHAAAAAAACAKGLLELWIPTDHDQMTSYNNSILGSITPESRLSRSSTLEISRRTRSPTPTPEKDEALRQKCLDTTNYSGMFARRDDLRQAQCDGTCEWLPGDPDFISWLKGESARKDNRILYVEGKAGSGKSVLMATILENVSSNKPSKDITVSHFFDSKSGSPDAHQQSYGGMLRAVLHQLTEKLPSSSDTLEGLDKLLHPEGNEKKKIVATSTLEQCVFFMMSRAEQGIRLFIDAAEECSSDKDVITFLRKVLNTHHNVYICLSCQEFSGLPTKLIRKGRMIKVQQRNEDDIRAYVRSRLEDAGATSRRAKARCNRLLEYSSHLFLWVRLVMDNIIDEGPDYLTEDEFEALLSQEHEELNTLYKKLLEKKATNPKREMEGWFILQTILSANEPLTVNQLRDAWAMQQNGFPERSCSMADIQHSRDELDETGFVERITSICRGFLEVKQQQVRFIHDSARRFLCGSLATPHLNSIPDLLSDDFETHCHFMLLRLCLEIFHLDELGSASELELRRYAIRHWLSHGRACGELLALPNFYDNLKLLPRCAEKAERLTKLTVDDMFLTEAAWHFALKKEKNLLVLMAWEGCSQLLKLHVKTKCDCSVDPESCLGNSQAARDGILFAAARAGHEEIILWHTELGCNINSQNGAKRGTPLYMACLEGHENVVRLLLQEGAVKSLTIKTNFPQAYPILVAARYGLTNIVKHILDHPEVNPEEQLRLSHKGWVALHYAVWKGRADTVRLLVKRMSAAGVSVHLPDFNGYTPLILAEQVDVKEKGAKISLLKNDT